MKNDRRKLIGLDRASQQPASPDDVVLSDEFAEVSWAHARCKWCVALSQLP